MTLNILSVNNYLSFNKYMLLNSTLLWYLFCRNTNEICFYRNKNLLYKLEILNFVEWKFKYISPRSCRHVKDKFWFFLDSEKSTVWYNWFIVITMLQFTTRVSAPFSEAVKVYKVAGSEVPVSTQKMIFLYIQDYHIRRKSLTPHGSFWNLYSRWWKDDIWIK